MVIKKAWKVVTRELEVQTLIRRKMLFTNFSINSKTGQLHKGGRDFRKKVT